MAILQKYSTEDLSVVISTYNRPALAIQCAAKIRTICQDCEIIIVDQDIDSTIKDHDLAKYKIKHVKLDKPHMTKARNAGIKAASGPIIVFLDDDVEVTKTTLASHAEAYANPEVVGVAGRAINDGEALPKQTDVVTGKTNFMGTQFISNFWSTRTQDVDFPYGCNMSFRKSVLDQVGNFDENYPNMFDEIDLAARIVKLGIIRFVPETLVYHHKAPSGGARTDNQTRFKLLYKYYGYYLAKNVVFPFSIISLIIRSISVLRDDPSALSKFYRGYLNYYVKK